MTDFEMLLACYRSGQVSERQWQEHLQDRAFREWVEDQLSINCPSACSGRDNPGQEAAMLAQMLRLHHDDRPPGHVEAGR